MANEHLVFKIQSIDPSVKLSEIVASINIEKVTPQIIASITYLLLDTLPVYGLAGVVSASDAAGCNWAAYIAMATDSFKDILPVELRNKFPSIDFDVKIAFNTKQAHSMRVATVLP